MTSPQSLRAGTHGCFGCNLHLPVYRRLNLETAGAQLPLAHVVDEFLPDCSEQVWIGAGSSRSRIELRTGSNSFIALRLIDPLFLQHYAKYRVATLFCDAQPFIGIVAIWRANHSSDQRCLSWCQLLRRCSVVYPRGFAKPTDFAPVSMTEVNFVEISLENIILGKSQLDDQRDSSFDHLSRKCSFVREKPRLRNLLCNRASALGDPARRNVCNHRSSDADWIDSQVTSEAGIFGRQKC